MSYLEPSASSRQSTERIGRGAVSGESQRQRYAPTPVILICSSVTWFVGNSPVAASIHVLDDDSLITIFYFYRPFVLGEDDDNDYERLFGGGSWVRGRWWYKLAQVCQRWRSLILGSAFHLGVSLVCAKGTPVAEMLEHSPSLPIVVDYTLDENEDITADEEEAAILALKKCGRVRRIRFKKPVMNLQKLIVVMGDEYPILEHLIIMRTIEDLSTILVFPETLQAPHLRHLLLVGFSLPQRCRLLTTAVGLVTLYLAMIHPSTYFPPNTLLQWLSSMPQLETLAFGFAFPTTKRDLGRQLTRTPNMTSITLPNLHALRFQGVKTYLEAFVHQITAPHLKKVEVVFTSQLTFPTPRLLQFLNSAENLMLKSAKIEFADENVDVEVYPPEQVKMYALSITVASCHLDWQVSSAVQIFNSLSPVFSAVEHLTLEHREHRQSSEEHNEVDPTEWRKLLGYFRNVKTLRVPSGLVCELSRCLQLDDGDDSLELLPELQELTYSRRLFSSAVFTSFTNARRDAGRPITLIRSDYYTVR